MKLVLKFMLYIVLLKAAVVGGWFGSAGWDAAFVNERTFSMPFGLLDWGALISWCFFLLFFFALGLLVGGLFGPPHGKWWALALGAIYGFIYFLWSQHFFYLRDTWATYFWAYGQYFVPSLGALAGSVCGELLSRLRAKPAGA